MEKQRQISIICTHDKLKKFCKLWNRYYHCKEKGCGNCVLDNLIEIDCIMQQKRISLGEAFKIMQREPSDKAY